MPRILLIADSHTQWNPDSDPALPLIEELLRRDYWVELLDLGQCHWKKDRIELLRDLPVRKVLFAERTEACFLGLDSLRRSDGNSYDVILHRKTTVESDSGLINISQIFSDLHRRVLQIRNPELGIDEIERLRLEHLK
jgi:hypothetical protein